MSSIVSLIALISIGFVLGRKLLLAYSAMRPLTRKTTFLLVGCVLVSLLALTGRLAWLAAMIGILLTFMARNLPLLLRYAPQLHRFWQFFKTSEQRKHSTNDNAPAHGKMTAADAYKILDLKAPATKQEIILAHKRLMQKMHPDRGGSAYLASQINLAKDCLLKN